MATETPSFPTPDPTKKHGYIYKGNHFAEGAFRYAYAGIVNDGPNAGQKLVIKKWKTKDIFDETFWDNDIKCHEKAKELVDEWNKNKFVSKIYEVSIPFQVHQTTGENEKAAPNQTKFKEELLCEEYIEGKWEKWNSNSGYISCDDVSIQAFCHWTYHYSNGKLLMCDAQVFIFLSLSLSLFFMFCDFSFFGLRGVGSGLTLYVSLFNIWVTAKSNPTKTCVFVP